MTEAFKFLAVETLTDGDLQLRLNTCQPAEVNLWHVPAYLFDMYCVASGTSSTVRAGSIRLRVGWNEEVIRHAGHVGYAVEPAHRGQRYAERACRLLLPLARHHRMTQLWITCQPCNRASRRTLERLGAKCAGTFAVPADYPLDAGAERRKMCFYLDL